MCVKGKRLYAERLDTFKVAGSQLLFPEPLEGYACLGCSGFKFPLVGGPFTPEARAGAAHLPGGILALAGLARRAPHLSLSPWL